MSSLLTQERSSGDYAPRDKGIWMKHLLSSVSVHSAVSRRYGFAPVYVCQKWMPFELREAECWYPLASLYSAILPENT